MKTIAENYINLDSLKGLDVVPDSCPIVELRFKTENNEEKDENIPESQGDQWLLAFLGDYARQEFVVLICNAINKEQNEGSDYEDDQD